MDVTHDLGKCMSTHIHVTLTLPLKILNVPEGHFDLQEKSDMNATDSPVSKPWSDACAHKVLSALQGNDVHVAFDSAASP